MLFGCGSTEPVQGSGASENKETEKPEETTEEKPSQEASTAKIPDALSQSLITALGDSFADVDFNGVAYAVYGDEVILNYGREYDSKTVYRIASVSKQFTAASILMLCEQGRLSTSDTLDKFFPDYGGADKVQIHHLLAMRSGIGDYVTAYKDSDNIPDGLSAGNTAEQNRRVIEKWIFENTVPAPDITYDYSNSNFFLLAEIIEQVSGMPYEDFITKNILEPLKMSSTGFQDTWTKTDLPLADGYGDGEYGFYEYKGIRYGCGDMMSDAEDLVIWAREFIKGENRLLSGNTVSQMTTNYENAGYGYGLMLDENYKVVYHSGSLPPYHSMLAVFPGESVIIVGLDNREPSELYGVYEKLLKNANGALNS